MKLPLDVAEQVSMRQILIMAAIAAVILGAVPSTADSREVRIVNETGRGINFIGVNAPGDKDWSNNRVMSIIRDGTSAQVSVREGSTCRRDVRIAWAGNIAPAVLEGIDLCSAKTFILHYNEGTGPLSYEKR